MAFFTNDVCLSKTPFLAIEGMVLLNNTVIEIKIKTSCSMIPTLTVVPTTTSVATIPASVEISPQTVTWAADATKTGYHDPCKHSA